MSYLSNRIKRYVYFLTILSLPLTTLSILDFTTAQAAQNCAVFSQSVTSETTNVDQVVSDSGDQPQDQPIEQTYVTVEITPADVTISTQDALPKFECLYTLTPDAVLAPPTCSAFDINGVIASTPAAGTYPIRCEGGQYQNGFTPYLKIGTLTVVNSATPQSSPSPSPTNSSKPTPSPTPTPSPVASVKPTPTPTAAPESEIDTNAVLQPTGPVQSCTSFNGPDQVAVVVVEGGQPSESNSDLPTEVTYSPVEINSADYVVYEKSTLPNFKCLISPLPGKVIDQPICFAFDGENQLNSMPAAGNYAIKCTGGQYLEGFQPLFKPATLTVLALPRKAKPSPSPTPTPAPPAPSPTPSKPAPSPSSSAQSAIKTFELKSQDGEVTKIQVQLPDSLNNSRNVIALDENQNTSFVGGGAVFKLSLTQSGRVLTRISDPILVTVKTDSSDYIPATSANGIDWSALPRISKVSELPSSKNGVLSQDSSSFIFAIRELNYFGLKRQQAPVLLNIVSNTSKISIGSTFQLSIVGGSGNGAVTYQTTTSAICAVTAAGSVKTLKVGTCSIQAIKAGDNRFLSAKSLIKDISISKTGTSGTTSATKKPTTTPTVTPVSPAVASDFVILIDPRLEVASKKIAVSASAKSISVSSGQLLQLQVSVTDASSPYAFTLVLPTGGSLALTQSASKGTELSLQSMQFLRKGAYQLLIRKGSSTQISLVTLNVK